MIKRILVGVDFSEASREALQRGARWAERLEVPLEVLHVVHLPVPVMQEAYPAILSGSLRDELVLQATDHLHAWIQDLPKASARVVLGSPAEELVAAVDAESLLVIGQVGHSAIEHLLFGSTAARVVRHAPCDVLVVRTAPAANRKRGEV